MATYHGTMTVTPWGVVTFIPDPVVVTPPIQPVDPPPITTDPTTKTVGPNDPWQSVVDAAKPGDTILFKGGTYTRAFDGWNYKAVLMVNVSGLSGKPITLKNVAGEVPIFDAKGLDTYAIRIGFMDYRGPHDPSAVGVHDVIVDGLRATRAGGDGIEVANSYNVTVRNCWAYANNYAGNGYKAGINFDAGHDNVVDHCRAFDNGFGICSYEHQPGGAEPANPDGVSNVTLSNNFVFANSRSGNLGNSPGMDLRFATRCNYVGNIFYDNPDAGINGEGNNFCRVLNNICINNWQPGGNNEGGKLCVRGGGANLVAGNLFVGNGNCGFDATSGVGDLLVGNTFYGNGSWGILAEGRETQLFNNIIAGNSTRVANDYPEQDAPGWSLISDWNRYGSGPLKSTANDTLTTLPLHSSISPTTLTSISLPRTDPRQINTPEMLWGVSTIEEARAKIVAAYRPATAIPGTTTADVAARCNSNIPKIIAALDAAIASASASPDFQMKQATYTWQKMKTAIAGGWKFDLSSLPDNGVMGAVKP